MITVSLMVLLALLAVAMLSLGSISLRASRAASYAATARANAQMALTMAIGDLQAKAGGDTRITARADLLGEGNPLVTGAWKSWEGADHDLQGRPSAPGDYANEKRQRFLGWLISSADSQKLPDTKPGAGKALLVGNHSAGSGTPGEDPRIALAPLPVTTDAATGRPSGSLAWWVSGENQKARLQRKERPENDSASGWAMRQKSQTGADPGAFQLDALLGSPELADKLLTRNEISLAVPAQSSPPAPQRYFHDLSTTATGLLTNSATGGWRKDLSLFTERYDQVPNSRLPLFQVRTDRDTSVSLPTRSNFRAPGSMLYPWSSYRSGSGDAPIYQHGAVASWGNLRDFATLYRSVNVSASGRGNIAPVATAIDGNAYDFLHTVRILPVIARIQWVYSHWAVTVRAPGSAATTYEPRLLLSPVITMWNPYNLELNFRTVPLDFSLMKPLPTALQYGIGTTRQSSFCSLLAGSTNYRQSMSQSGSLLYRINRPFTLQPGETMVFGAATPTPVAASQLLELTPGYQPKGGHYFPVETTPGKPINGSGADSFDVQVAFDTTYDDRGAGVGIYLDMSYAGSRKLAYRMVYLPTVARDTYPTVGELSKASLSAAASSPQPFLTTIFGARMASQSHLPAKGFLQSSPLVNYTVMGTKETNETGINRHYLGTGHPINSPFDFSFRALTPFSNYLPNFDAATNRGYIMTGFGASDGLSRCVIAEIPTRPLQSLGELQNWDLRYENPVPPFSLNIIGNSDASPLIPANAVATRQGLTQAENLQFDDSYCANHLLFDDWFVSSIAPNPLDFGKGGENLQTVYTNLLLGTKPLPNTAYKPIPADTAAVAGGSQSEAARLATTYAMARDGWQTIASRLVVEGMFNVNSTSETAWRAMLGHARNQKIPHLASVGAGWDVKLSPEADHIVSRFSVAGDSIAGSPGSSGQFPNASEFTGYRVFTEQQLDALAVEMVKQVKARGPFLSLSEFVNRQLSSGELALAGAIQTALNHLRGSQSTDPYRGMYGNSIETTAQIPSAAMAEYQFPEAALGRNVYGLPGWTRQADILRPLAPVLSVRDDTFTVRAYGDARSPAGEIMATAVCEAVVMRVREYVNPADRAEGPQAPKNPVNVKFGRQFRVASLRWLSPEEI